jgi:hypothetical protein
VRCCHWATPEEQRLRPEKYDCRTCAWRLQHAQLWVINQEAIALAQLLGSRAVAETQSAAAVLARWLADHAWAEAEDMIRRLDLIFEILVPHGGESRDYHPHRRGDG